MFEKHKSWVIAALVISLWTITSFANTVDLTWHRIVDCTTSDSTIEGWHTDGTDKLCQDDDGAGTADVSCSTVLNKSGSTDTNFSGENFDDELGNVLEAAYCIIDMTRDGAAATSITIGGEECGGCEGDGKIIIADTASSTALVHEVGHTAGLIHLEPTVYCRIMNDVVYSSNCRVIASERDEYEGL